jgi:hypothetical protein
MRTRRTTWLASGAALLLIASVTGLASAAPLVGDVVGPAWVDTNGNGVADSCETGVVADDAAAAAAFLAADLDGNGTISTSEAARTDWTGGRNCNHGGFVSSVARSSSEGGDTTTVTTPADCPVVVLDPATQQTGDGTDATDATDPTSGNHGSQVSIVAQSDAVGGPNCNHGGAVSAAAKGQGGTASGDAKSNGKAGKSHGQSGKSHGKGHRP